MQRLKNIKWKLLSLRLIITIFSANCLIEATRIYAQADEADVTENEKSYFLAYAVVLFLVVLGVAVVARSGRRAEKQKMIEKELEYRLEKMSGTSNDR